MIQLKFSVEEFLIHQPKSISVEIADKILKHHIAVIQPIREKLGFPVFVSKHSGYRPVLWEKAHGRSGDSEHCYFAKGAVDYTCGTRSELLLLLEHLKQSAYTRVCYYPKQRFIHCDYKASQQAYYECINGQWDQKC